MDTPYIKVSENFRTAFKNSRYINDFLEKFFSLEESDWETVDNAI